MSGDGINKEPYLGKNVRKYLSDKKLRELHNQSPTNEGAASSTAATIAPSTPLPAATQEELEDNIDFKKFFTLQGDVFTNFSGMISDFKRVNQKLMTLRGENTVTPPDLRDALRINNALLDKKLLTVDLNRSLLNLVDDFRQTISTQGKAPAAQILKNLSDLQDTLDDLLAFSNSLKAIRIGIEALESKILCSQASFAYPTDSERQSAVLNVITSLTAHSDIVKSMSNDDFRQPDPSKFSIIAMQSQILALAANCVADKTYNPALFADIMEANINLKNLYRDWPDHMAGDVIDPSSQETLVADYRKCQAQMHSLKAQMFPSAPTPSAPASTTPHRSSKLKPSGS